MTIEKNLTSAGNPILIAAATPKDLIEHCESLNAQLKSDEAADAFQSLTTLTRYVEIPKNVARMGFVAESPKEMASLLKRGLDALKKNPKETSWELRQGVYYRREGVDDNAKVVALFPGQGSQYVGMGQDLLDVLPGLVEARDLMDELFQKDGHSPLSEIMYPDETGDKAVKKEQEALLTLTEHAQPSIGVFSFGLFKALQSVGIDFAATAGHSFGELTALWAAGIFSDADYCFLAKSRGRAMAALDEPDFDTGSMLAVKADVAEVQAEAANFPDITVANLNSNKQAVLAGPKKAVLDAQAKLKEKGYSVVLLPVSAAFHTSLVGHAQKPFADALQSVSFQDAECDVYSNSTGTEYPSDSEAMKSILSDHILNPVLFKNEIEKIYDAGGRVFVECGPKPVLSNLVADILEGKPHVTVALNASPKQGSHRQLINALTHLKLLGLELDLDD